MSRRHKARAKVGNMQLQGAGASGAGDRSSQQNSPITTLHPYYNQNFIARWQEYVRWYMTSWEAQKIVNIPVDDALREPFALLGLDDNDTKLVMAAYDDMDCHSKLVNAGYLQRLLGGSVILMGVKQNDTPDAAIDKPIDYNTIDTGDLIYLNVISCDRMTNPFFESDPFSPHFDKPLSYSIMGQQTHISRMLVFDGNPLFGRHNANLLQNFRVNPCGFGESILAALYDILIRMTGTQQGAYQLVNLASVLLAKCDNLMSLQGTGTDQILRDAMNQISIYRAAVLSGKDMEITQHSASFGSVPELVMTFAQLLSAASDIPATRFLGQAPGGLNATGDSDLENYYNNIAAYQKKVLKKQLIKLFDVLIPSVIGQSKWRGLRDKFDIEFAPLWNLSETETAEIDSKNATTFTSLFNDGIIPDVATVVEELRARNLFKTEFKVEEVERPADQEANDPEKLLDQIDKFASGKGDDEKKE